MNDIIVGLVYQHMNVEPMVVQKLDTNATLVVFPEGEEVEKTHYIHRCGWNVG